MGRSAQRSQGEEHPAGLLARRPLHTSDSGKARMTALSGQRRATVLGRLLSFVDFEPMTALQRFC
jgi:hypothetical protein